MNNEPVDTQTEEPPPEPMQASADATPEQAVPAKSKGNPNDPAPPLMRLVVAAIKVLYSSQETVQKIVHILSEGPDKRHAIQFAVELIIRILKSKAKGVTPDLLEQVKPIIASEIINIGIEAKVLDQAMLEKSAAPQGGEQPQPQPQPQQQPPAQQPPAAPPAGEGLVNQAMQGA